MALTDYNLSPDDNPSNIPTTPEGVKRRRALADALLKQGMDSSPAAGGKWGGALTALNRGLAGALGGYQMGQADRQEGAARQQSAAQSGAAFTPISGNYTPTEVPGMPQHQIRSAGGKVNADRGEGMKPDGTPYANDEPSPLDPPLFPQSRDGLVSALRRDGNAGTADRSHGARVSRRAGVARLERRGACQGLGCRPA